MSIIPYGAFMDCRFIERIEITGNVRYVLDYAFYKCYSLEDIMSDDQNNTCLPNSIQEIGSYVYADCISLEYMYLPTSLTKIGAYTFENMHQMRELLTKIADLLK